MYLEASAKYIDNGENVPPVTYEALKKGDWFFIEGDVLLEDQVFILCNVHVATCVCLNDGEMYNATRLGIRFRKIIKAKASINEEEL